MVGTWARAVCAREEVQDRWCARTSGQQPRERWLLMGQPGAPGEASSITSCCAPSSLVTSGYDAGCKDMVGREGSTTLAGSMCRTTRSCLLPPAPPTATLSRSSSNRSAGTAPLLTRPAAAAAPAKAKKAAPRKGGTARDISGATSGLLFPGCGAMMLCRVTLGRLAQGNSGLRKPPDGSDAVVSAAIGGPRGGGGGGPAKDLWDVGAVGEQNIFAVFDNAQAYPEYIVHIR